LFTEEVESVWVVSITCLVESVLVVVVAELQEFKKIKVKNI